MNARFNSSTVEREGERLVIRLIEVDFGSPQQVVRLECDFATAGELQDRIALALKDA
jgi:hypothetical protein